MVKKKITPELLDKVFDGVELPNNTLLAEQTRRANISIKRTGSKTNPIYNTANSERMKLLWQQGKIQRDTTNLGRESARVWQEQREQINSKRESGNWRKNVKNSKLTEFKYLVILPNGDAKVFDSSNDALRWIGIEITKQTGGQGYRFFPKDGSKLQKVKGKYKGYTFQKIPRF